MKVAPLVPGKSPTHAAPLHGPARGRSAARSNQKTRLVCKSGLISPDFTPFRYWILWRNDDAQMRAAFGMPPASEKRFPHQGLCAVGFESPSELMADLASKGWRKDALDHQPNRIALVETTPTGIRVTEFPTYAAAVKAHKTGEDPGKLKPCPFCGKRDKLVLIDWTHERPDGTEYIGDAVKCDRCDTVVPLAVFQNSRSR